MTGKSQKTSLKAIRGFGIAAAAWVLGAQGALAGTKAQELSLVGPAENLNCANSEIQVLGIRLKSESPRVLAAACEVQATGNTAYVAASALVDVAGTAKLKSLTLVQGEIYVPGASAVYVRGPVTSVDQISGQFFVAGGRFSLVGGQLPNIGATVEVIGTQPVVGSAVLVSAVGTASRDGIVGSGVSTNGIVGSGKSTSGIVGSGVSLNGIVGSGAATTGIVGSGASTTGIVGSGKSTTGIVGSGAATTGIVGSGASTNGIVGSGASTAGIVGSGKSTSGIVGSGAATSGIVGSGTSTNGIVGSGASTAGIVGSGS